MLRTRRNSPFVYCLLKENCLYIGMTLDDPIKRWSSSISDGGSFYKAVKAEDDGIISRNKSLKASCYELTRIANELVKDEWKTTTCYAEHLIHEYFCENRYVLGKKVTVISDTVRTAPRRCRYNWINDEARNAFEFFVTQLKGQV